jgi:DNA mismatch repair protein MutS
VEIYLHKLVRAGYRVAICEQLEKPSKDKKIVRRGVVEVITPGIAISDNLLDVKSNNFLAALHYGKRGQMGIAFLDISTGEFLVSEGDDQYIDKLLQSFSPSEIIFPKSRTKEFESKFGTKFYTYPIEEWVFMSDYTREKLLEQFEVKSLKGFGIEGLELAQVAAGSVLHYVATTENTNLKHISAIARIEPDRYVWLDKFTIRNLEMIYSAHETGTPLIKILDKTVSPMGARLLKKWVVLPLKNKKPIEARLEMVAYFLDNVAISQDIEHYIQQIGDIERLISKVPLGKINPREVVQLKRALTAIEPVKNILQDSNNASLQRIAERINLCAIIRDKIAKEIVDEPPVNLAKGKVIEDGISTDLDELRDLIGNSKEHLVRIQQKEATRTGIDNLKIGFNNVKCMPQTMGVATIYVAKK